MWTNENRGRYDPQQTTLSSDLTDEEWALIGPLIPRPSGAGTNVSVVEREVVNGVMYILSTGCTWLLCPRTCARSTVNDISGRWDYDGTLDRHPPRALREVS